MDGGPTIVTARSRAEFELCAGVVNRVSPQMPVTAEQMEHAATSDRDSRLFLARVGDVPTGTGYTVASSAGPKAMYAMVRVVPELRRRGVGRALYRAISEHARELGREWLWGRVRDDDPETLAAVVAHGFTETGREPLVAVDPQRAPPAGPVPDGVEIVSLAERPDLARAAWEVEVEAIQDVPAPDALTARPFERWVDYNLEGPDALPAGSFVAIVAGEVVGHTGLAALPARPHSAENLFTGVRRAWRGRGIASALKQAQIAWARDVGYEWIQTTNDEPNAAMRAVNAKLGYEPVMGSIFVRGPLALTAGQGQTAAACE